MLDLGLGGGWAGKGFGSLLARRGATGGVRAGAEASSDWSVSPFAPPPPSPSAGPAKGLRLSARCCLTISLGLVLTDGRGGGADIGVVPPAGLAPPNGFRPGLDDVGRAARRGGVGDASPRNRGQGKEGIRDTSKINLFLGSVQRGSLRRSNLPPLAASVASDGELLNGLWGDDREVLARAAAVAMGEGLLAAEGRLGGAPAGMDFTEGDRAGVSGLVAMSMGLGAGRLGG